MLDKLIAQAFLLIDSPKNSVPEVKALEPSFAGMRIFEKPIFGFASADDYYFEALAQTPEANVAMNPHDWCLNAKTVISFFLPYAERVASSNRGGTLPSLEWLHGRLEGQEFLSLLCISLANTLSSNGYEAVAPMADNRFWSRSHSPDNCDPHFTSNWSERHSAYACGLGTFSLAKHIITKHGGCCRLGSVITSLELAPTHRDYQGLYEYCSFCGACVSNCPVNAINKANGKDHSVCSMYLDEIEERFTPYYGCAKCQTAVPCEKRIPVPNRKQWL
jgi:epoxyqueuosine reductase QueG